MVNNKVKVTQKVHKYIKKCITIEIMHFIHKLLKENNAYNIYNLLHLMPYSFIFWC